MDGQPLFLPDNVFLPPNFHFLFTMGGSIAYDYDEYNKLVNFLKSLGEDGFYIFITGRERQQYFYIGTDSNIGDFNDRVSEFDEAFGLLPYDTYIHGETGSWGIYLSENPTVNVIGCEPGLLEGFKTVYSVMGDGFEQVVDFIFQEFNHDMGKLDMLRSNYESSEKPDSHKSSNI